MGKRGPPGKVERNASIIRYHRTHPKSGPTALGRMYKTSKQRVFQLIKKADAEPICINCYHGITGVCSCREAEDVITERGRCPDWQPGRKRRA